MMLNDFLTPIDKENLFEGNELNPAQIGNYVHIAEGSGYDLSEFNLAIIGVGEDRASVGNIGSAKSPDAIRKQFYKLYMPPTEREFKLIDLGNIIPGESVRDTYFAIAQVCVECFTNKVIPIIIGGSHDLTMGQYLGYKSLQTLINMVVIDERIDMMETGNKQPDSSSFVMNILTNTPNYLFNYSHVGYQTYLNDAKMVATLESLNFDCMRLGLVRANLEEVEPVLRDADLLSIDISSIRQADAPAHAQASPNGFTGEELCQISRYAGLSDKLTSIGFYETNIGYDNNNQTAQLVAQMIWYFVEGYYSRIGDYPVTIEEHLKFTVHLGDADHDIIFWKSRKTERWWMEMPFNDKPNLARHTLVPCSLKDYEQACEQELPDRWMKAYTKLV